MKKIAIFSTFTLVLFGCGVEPGEWVKEFGIRDLCNTYLDWPPENEMHVASVAELKSRGIEPKECMAMDQE